MSSGKRKSVLIINKTQFGYHIDSFKYCQYLKPDFDVTYICFDTNKEKQVLDGVTVFYVNWEGSFITKGKRFIRACKHEMNQTEYDSVFCIYFQGVSLLVNSGNKSRMILDIRTGYVGNKQLKKLSYNLGIYIESRFFKTITVISDSLAKLLKIRNYHLLPLGSDVLSEVNKNYDEFKLIYVGALTNRRITETVRGCKDFVSQTKTALTYAIFGTGTSDEVKALLDEIGDVPYIQYHGFKHHSEIQPFFDECNIGISYVPITNYFNVQPPTKTFEYINAGMICIATGTDENRKIISESNGILCKDSAEAFTSALIELSENNIQYTSSTIRSTVAEFTWKKIVENQLIPLLNRN